MANLLGTPLRGGASKAIVTREFLETSPEIGGMAIGFLIGALSLKYQAFNPVKDVVILMPLLVIGFALSRDYFFYKGENHELDEITRATVLSTIQMFTQAGVVCMHILIGVFVTNSKAEVFFTLAAILVIWRLLVRLPDRVNI